MPSAINTSARTIDSDQMGLVDLTAAQNEPRTRGTGWVQTRLGLVSHEDMARRCLDSHRLLCNEAQDEDDDDHVFG